MSLLEQRLTAIRDREREAGLLRRCPRIWDRSGPEYQLDGKQVVGFCSNDYLGLADTKPHSSAPTGAAASRLVAGDLPLHREVEAALADLVGTSAAVVFPSGYQLNVGVLPSLIRSEDQVHSDERNHASLIDGVRLSASKPTILPHLEPPPRAETDAEGIDWWVTESIFSMDGDGPSVDHLRRHALRQPLYLDEAHALGLFADGRGRAPTNPSPQCLVGTLGKALGCAGAFLAGSTTVCDHVRTHARSFVFSTGVSPLLLRSILGALERVRGPDGEARRERLRARMNQLRRELSGLCPSPPPFFTPILPLLIGDNEAAIEVSAALVDRGFHVQAIRPPTVPRGTARLRITVTSEHRPDHVTALARALRETLAAVGLPNRAGQP